MEHVIAPDDRYLPPPVDCHVKAGEQVEVDDDTAQSLREQGWDTARQAAARRREERKAAQAEAAEVAEASEGEAPESPVSDVDDAGVPAEEV